MRRSGLIAAGLALMLSLASSTTLDQRRAGTGGAQPALTSLHMVSSTVGWATTATQVVRTTDGGERWSDVTPVTPSFFRGPGPTAFLSERVAWVGFWSQVLEQPGHVTLATTIYHTTDGGQTWRAGDSIPPESLAAYGGQQMHFVDSQHGWLVSGVTDGSSSPGAALYRTVNGGAHWDELFAGRLRGPPVAGQWSGFPVTCGNLWLRFVDASYGWAGGDCGTAPAVVFVTHDAGELWQPQPLPAPAGVAGFCATGCLAEPTYVGARDVVLTVRYNDTVSGNVFDRPNSVLYSHHYLSETWRTSRFPAGRVGAVSFLDASTGWAMVDRVLYATHDGGLHWERTSSGALGSGADLLQFVDARTGWALGHSPSGSPLLGRTLDGGSEWLSLSFGWVPVVAFFCRLPFIPDAQEPDQPRAGFIAFPDGQLVVDPSGEFVRKDNLYTSVALPHLSGITGPHFYHRALGRWLPAYSDAVSPDGSSYAYANSTDPAFPNSNLHSALHIVAIVSGADQVVDLPGLPPLMSWAVDRFDQRGVYLFQGRWEAEPTAERWLVDPSTGRLEEVDKAPEPASAPQPANAWLTDVSPADPNPVVSSYDGTEVPDRLVKQGNPPVVWFYRPGKVVELLGVGPDGHPLVVVATGLSSEDRRELWLVRAPGAAQQLPAGPELFAFFGSQSSLTDRHGLWIGSGEGVFLYEPIGGFRRVAHVAGRFAGECR